MPHRRVLRVFQLVAAAAHRVEEVERLTELGLDCFRDRDMTAGYEWPESLLQERGDAGLAGGVVGEVVGADWVRARDYLSAG